MSTVDPGLREELLAMAAADPDARQRLDCHPPLGQDVSEQELTAAEHARAVDATNTAHIKAIVQAHGWPGRTLVGDDGAQAAWLLVQHADHDPAFQRACLELLAGAVQANEAGARHHAYLTDRVLLAEGSQQLYGTQFLVAGGSWQHGRWPILTQSMTDAARSGWSQ
jgi:hypothetical protein